MKRIVSMKVGYPVWQKGYYDHIIRNESEYQGIIKYITDNPASWLDDDYNG